jgi:hypothetical protein
MGINLKEGEDTSISAVLAKAFGSMLGITTPEPKLDQGAVADKMKQAADANQLAVNEFSQAVNRFAAKANEAPFNGGRNPDVGAPVGTPSAEGQRAGVTGSTAAPGGAVVPGAGGAARASPISEELPVPAAGTEGDPRGMIPVIRAAAAKYGVDPDVALKVARSEGLGVFKGDKGTSFGAFQLHVGGGLGDDFKRDTGLDPSDPKNEPATIDYAMRRLSETGWTPYHGAARIGVGPREGIGVRSTSASASFAPDFGQPAEATGTSAAPAPAAPAPLPSGLVQNPTIQADSIRQNPTVQPQQRRFDLAVGDSIAEGLVKGGYVPGTAESAVSGRTPQQVLDYIRSQPADAFAGKNVVLSTGATNTIPLTPDERASQMALVPQQIKALQDARASGVTVLGTGTGVAGHAAFDQQLRAAAQAAGAGYTGPLEGTPGGRWHPQDYGVTYAQAQRAIPTPAAPAPPVPAAQAAPATAPEPAPVAAVVPAATAPTPTQTLSDLLQQAQPRYAAVSGGQDLMADLRSAYGNIGLTTLPTALRIKSGLADPQLSPLVTQANKAIQAQYPSLDIEQAFKSGKPSLDELLKLRVPPEAKPEPQAAAKPADTALQPLQNAAQQSAAAVTQLSAAATTAQSSVAQVGQSASAASSSLEQTGTSATTVGSGLQTVSTSTTTLGTNLSQAGSQAQQAGEQFAQAGQSASQGGQQLGQGAGQAAGAGSVGTAPVYYSGSQNATDAGSAAGSTGGGPSDFGGGYATTSSSGSGLFGGLGQLAGLYTSAAALMGVKSSPIVTRLMGGLSLLSQVSKLFGSGGMLGGLFGGSSSGGGGLFSGLTSMFGGGGLFGGGLGGLFSGGGAAAGATAATGGGLLGGLFGGIGSLFTGLFGLFGLDKGGIIPSAAGGTIVDHALPATVKGGLRALAANSNVGAFAGGKLITHPDGGLGVNDGKGGRLIIGHPGELVVPAPETRVILNAMKGGSLPSAAGGMIVAAASKSWSVGSAGPQHLPVPAANTNLPSRISQGLQMAVGDSGPGRSSGDTHNYAISVSAIDSRTGAQFLMAHADTIASALGRSRRNFSAARR